MSEPTPAPAPRKRRLPAAFYNATSLFGFVLSLMVIALIFLLFLLDTFSGIDNPYVGLITFVALPPIFILGVLLVLIGMVRANRRAKKGLPEKALPQIDFNNAKHRRGFTLLAFGGLVFMALSAFGSYQAYEYTESVEFCGKVCHNVMKPEYVAYQNSPHARVTCVQCHIGSGATWYVKSKFSGAYQVYSTMFDKYSRPIATPIANLRPARETCEQCHWPSHFYAQKLSDKTYFASDETNTKFQTSMLLKIGGVEHGATEGIHAHMYLDNEISYIATDRQRQVIPYVESKDKNGKVTVYTSTEDKITDDQIRKGERRIVDCIDCHNRPSHRFPHPATTVNTALAKGWIDPGIPEVKRLAVELLEKPYKSEPAALAAIQKEFLAFYSENYAKETAAKKKELDAAIAQIRKIYQTSYFPEMKADWRSFPDNLDHMYSKGCFRCHDNKHVSKEGKVIRNDCNTCHTILTQKGTDGKQSVGIDGLAFQHPVDIGDAWKTTLCKDCHVPEREPEEKSKG